LEGFANFLENCKLTLKVFKTTWELDRAITKLQKDLSLITRAVGKKLKGRKTAAWFIVNCQKARTCFRSKETLRWIYYAVLRRVKREY